VYYSEGINSGLVDYVPCKEEMVRMCGMYPYHVLLVSLLQQSLAKFPAPILEELTQRVSAAYASNVYLTT